MRFLRKILLSLGLIIVLAVLKPILAKHFPISRVFHYNLLSVLQLLLLFWAVFTGIIETVFWKTLPSRTARIKSLLLFGCLIAIADAGSAWLLDHPRHIPRGCLIAFHQYYNNYDRDIVQFNKKITRYNPDLFYTLIPDNHSLFTNREFSDSIVTNLQGFRTFPHTDTSHPAIFCLGDSYTFGWGVQQNECYPFLLRDILHEGVLNTGVPSYGTARELASIRSLDKTGLSTIIIQYCYNDAEENEACIDNNYQPRISSSDTYDSAVGMVKWSKVWFPGKYSCTLLKLLADDNLEFLPKHEQEGHSGDVDKEAVNFLAVLAHAGLDFTKTRVFVFDIGEYQTLSGRFLNSVEKKLSAPEYDSLFAGHVRTVHIENLLTPDDFYLLDGHINASGHKKVAACLAQAIDTIR